MCDLSDPNWEGIFCDMTLIERFGMCYVIGFLYNNLDTATFKEIIIKLSSKTRAELRPTINLRNLPPIPNSQQTNNQASDLPAPPSSSVDSGLPSLNDENQDASFATASNVQLDDNE